MYFLIYKKDWRGKMAKEYIISDAAKLLDVEPHVLRYWEEELELEITRNELGHRYYKEEDVIILQKVKSLKEKGFQLKAIKMLLPTLIEESLEDEIVTNANKIALKEDNKPSTTKLEQFQQFIKLVFDESLKNNNEVLKSQIKQDLAEELGIMFKERDYIDEKRYKKLDETIREVQKMRQEVATSSNNKKGLFSRMKNKVSTSKTK
jgi:DNA-binding transcriptional MerR regulator